MDIIYLFSIMKIYTVLFLLYVIYIHFKKTKFNYLVLLKFVNNLILCIENKKLINNFDNEWSIYESYSPLAY